MQAHVRRIGLALAGLGLVGIGTVSPAQAARPTVDAPTSGATAATSADGTVTGRVVRDGASTPIRGVCVSLIDAAIRDPFTASGSACTDQNGRFSVVISPGRYVAEFSDATGRFATEYNGNRTDVSKAPVLVVRRNAVTRVGASLAVGGQLSGRAVDATTGMSLASACAYAYFGRTDRYVRAVSTCSDASGRWSIKGLPAGTFTVGVFGPGSMQPTWAYGAASQQQAHLFPLSGGAKRSIGPVRIASLGSVTGVVTDANGGPVANAWINLDGRFPGRAGPGEGPLSAHTDAAGRYTVSNVSPGSYRPIVYADDYTSFAPEWAGDSDTLAGATPVTVTSGSSAVLDLQVAAGARLAINIVNADGTPAGRNLDGFITLTTGEYIGDFDYYNGSSSGSNALPGGSFILRLSDGETGDTYWYDGATSADAADPVTLARGETKAITFHLPN
ncbi:hypothetical protein BA895_11230 [Humibacillus sp. DSM 29435]|uniref:carboxypeptidase-like regulatory domain-containing protein n=1 Tax=Humibacillus sp. DSM 29435 TaxID=1869167 RepID=UPI0008733788|nr:carboxypeptidase-like regulatory domain-containing protein [Humibacillus sp. DSM 29435]OFE14191.1 hypothetical protein BA895_11230 [Humibacillus sp. DSM 29435]